MTVSGFLQIGFFFGLLLLLAWPLGRYMARVYQVERTWLDPVLGPLERWIYRACGVQPSCEMTWRGYAGALLVFSLAGTLLLFLQQSVQSVLPLNPQGFGPVSPDLAFNTAVSFNTNTNWQAYGGEGTMSHLTQMAGLAVQNFLSAATGMAGAIVLIRGLARRSVSSIGNFWVDLTRTTLYILLPLSLLLSLLLVSQGVVQTFSPYQRVDLLQPVAGEKGVLVREQTVPLGPAASQVAIKQLGTNGGGFFNANSSHPLENPTPFTDLLEALALLLIPMALLVTFGRMVGDMRQGLALIAAVLVVLIPLTLLCYRMEQGGNPRLAGLGVDQDAGALQSGGNMEGKEVRFGAAGSARFAAATTATSCGAVNSMHDSFTPLGGMVPLFLIQLGEIVPGGAGSGLYTLLVFALITVFIAGLMVGRTPEYLGKKVGSFEMKMASLVVLIPAAAVLAGTAVGVGAAGGVAGIANPGPHGFTEVLYAFSSCANNNGSAFAGLAANTPFYNLILAAAMLLGRFGVLLPVLAVAGSLAAKNRVPVGAGTLPTHTALFVALLVSVFLLVGALTFLPSLALGPVAEHLLGR